MVFLGILLDFNIIKNISHSLMAAKNMPEYTGWTDCWRMLRQNVSY